MSKIKSHLINKPLFLSLTYHYGHTKSVPGDKTHLHNFLVSLRDFDPDVAFIWRIELQKRGAPHYHLIIFPNIKNKIKNIDKYIRKVILIWHSIADPNSKAHGKYGCRITRINNYRHACSYVAKYIAKVPDDCADIEQGKHWGCSRNLPNSPFHTFKIPKLNAVNIIERLRKWLLKNGKENYSDDYYFNADRPQVVFIQADEFYDLLKYNTSTMDFSCL